MKKEDLVGKEVYGFKFPDGKDNVCWNSCEMDRFIDMKGTITKVYGDRVYVKFTNYSGKARNVWCYPISMVGENLVKHKTQEIFKIL